MRILLQRVSKASVEIEGLVKSSIADGLLVLLGIESEDNDEDVNWLVKKLTGLRIFGDNEGKMNLSIREIDGEILLISQFTLHASTKKGNRPSFIKAASPDFAIPLYRLFINALEEELGIEKIKTGKFGAEMKVQLLNDGPVTIFLDSKNKE